MTKGKLIIADDGREAEEGTTACSFLQCEIAGHLFDQGLLHPIVRWPAKFLPRVEEADQHLPPENEIAEEAAESVLNVTGSLQGTAWKLVESFDLDSAFECNI